jgi:hypothetical protein
MVEIIKAYKQTLPAMRFIGKKYSTPPNWSEWFENGWFDKIENAMGGAEAVHKLYEDGDAYVELTRVKADEPFEFWLGMFVTPGTAVPDGFLHQDFSEFNLGVFWVYGKEEHVMQIPENTHKCLDKIAEEGREFAYDKDGAAWEVRRYQCPRFTTPDKQSNIILDYCWHVK